MRNPDANIFNIVLLVAAPILLRAQTISGSWYGRADVDLTGMYNNYLTELVIKQKGNRVDGIFGYYFRNKYQSYLIHGTYNPQDTGDHHPEPAGDLLRQQFHDQQHRLHDQFPGPPDHVADGNQADGTFYHDGKYKYMCPDLKVNYSLDMADKSQDSAMAMAARAQIWKPQADDYGGR